MSAISALLMLMSLFQSPSGPAQAAAARMSGQVVDADSRKPVAGARVILIGMSRETRETLPAPQQALTNAKGQFSVEGVPPGRYRLEVQKAGFAPPVDGSERRTFDITSGQTISIEIQLRKGGAISGRVVDADGEPLSDISVSALRITAGNRDRAVPMNGQAAQTNDFGDFRIAGLPEGEYVVVATPRGQPPFEAAPPTDEGTTLAPTFYPGTINRDEAQSIAVASGQTVERLQFAMMAVRAFRVSGIVVDENNMPLARAMVNLMGDPRTMMLTARMPLMSQTRADGTFTIGGVIPGQYRLHATIPIVWSVREGAGAGGSATFSGGTISGTSSGDIVGGTFTSTGGPIRDGRSGRPEPLEVNVSDADITGLRIVVPAPK